LMDIKMDYGMTHSVFRQWVVKISKQHDVVDLCSEGVSRSEVMGGIWKEGLLIQCITCKRIH